MNTHLINFADLRPLDDKVISQYINIFLCDGAINPETNASIMVSPDFRPDIFSVQDGMSNNGFLAEHERNFNQRLQSQVRSKLQKLEQYASLKLETLSDTSDFCEKQIQRLLAYSLDGQSVSSILLINELPYIIDRVLSFCLYGDPSFEVYIYEAFNKFSLQVIPNLIQHHLWRKHVGLKDLLLYSIASGLIGLDMKIGVPTPIPLKEKIYDKSVEFSEENIEEYIWSKLNSFNSRGLTLDCCNDFFNVVTEQECRCVWFLDDYIESMFDLLLIQEILLANPRLKITLVPKKGRFDSDASYDDIVTFLHLPLFEELLNFLAFERLKISPYGPMMGTANLKKLSPELVEEILRCDCVFIKGSTTHEMFQGGLTKPCFTAYALTRDFNESQSGFDARLFPLLFFQTQAGEYAYWGFKGRAVRKMMLDDGREISVCFSTVREHEMRKRLKDPDKIFGELQKLLHMQEIIDLEYIGAYSAELYLLKKMLEEYK